MTIYIPARLRRRHDNGEEQRFDDLRDLIVTAFDSENDNTAVLVAAPYGTGKTRLCEELANDLDARNLEHELHRCRDIEKLSEIEKIFTNKKKRIVIFDALDEIKDIHLLKKIMNERDASHNTLVMTTRSTFLDQLVETLWHSEYNRNITEFAKANRIKIYDLLPFTESDSIEYLVSAGLSTRQIEAFAKEPIWSDIVSHPLWLSIFSEVILSDEFVGVANLYTLMDRYITQIYRKTNIDPVNMQAAFRDFALSITYSVRIKYKDVSTLEKEFWTILERSGEFIAFKHRIFLDYFLISTLADQIESAISSRILKRFLLNGVQIQLLSFALDAKGRPDFLDWIRNRSEISGETSNDYTLANFVELFKLRGYQVDELLRAATNFHSADLQETEIQDLELTKKDFKNAVLGGAKIKNVIFNRCNFEGTDFGDKVGVVDMHSRNNLVAAVSRAGFVYVFSTHSGLNKIIQKNIPNATAICLLEDGIVIGYQDGTVQIFDETLMPISPAEPIHTDKVMDIASDAGVITSISCDGSVGFINRYGGASFSVRGHEDIGHGIDYRSGLETAITVGYDGKLRAFSAKSGKEVADVAISKLSIYSCKYNSSGRLVAAGGYGGRIAVVDTRDWSIVWRLNDAHKSTIWCIEWVSDTTFLVVGWDRSIVLCDYANRSFIAYDYNCYNSKVVATDNSIVVSSATGRLISLLDRESYKILQETRVDAHQGMDFENVVFKECYGLSPQRNDMLEFGGARILEPFSVQKHRFPRSRRSDHTLQIAVEHEFEEQISLLYQSDNGSWKFGKEVDDPRYVRDDVITAIKELIVALENQGIDDPTLTADLANMVIANSDSSTGASKEVDVDRLIGRLNGTLSLGGRVSEIAGRVLEALTSGGTVG